MGKRERKLASIETYLGKFKTYSSLSKERTLMADAAIIRMVEETQILPTAIMDLTDEQIAVRYQQAKQRQLAYKGLNQNMRVNTPKIFK